MKIKSYSLVLLCLLCSILTFAQTKVLTTDGKTFLTESVIIADETISFDAVGQRQFVLKNNVLVVVPDGQRPYTFRVKNGKKMTIKRKFILNDYTGTDKPKMFAYKYMGGKANISQLYVLNADSNMTEEQFASVYTAMRTKLKTNNIIGTTVTIGLLLISVVNLVGVLQNAEDLKSISEYVPHDLSPIKENIENIITPKYNRTLFPKYA